MNDPNEYAGWATEAARSQSLQTAQELWAFKITIADFFAKQVGMVTTPQEVLVTAKATSVENEALRNLIERCYTANDILEVKALISGSLVPKEG